MSEQLAKIEDVRMDLTLTQVGKLFAQSGFFADSRGEAQAITKIMAGRENGFGPFTSMSGINIIKGKMELGADMLATAIKRSGKYNYRVKTMTPQSCEVEFFERSDFTGGQWRSIGISQFTFDDAKKAGLVSNDTYSKYTRNMLFARAMSNGQAWFCPDVFESRAYTEGEISGVAGTPETETKTEKPSSGKTKADQLNALYSAIETLTTDRNHRYIDASVKKWLSVDELRDCQDVKQAYDYYMHIVDSMVDDINKHPTRAADLSKSFIEECSLKNFKGALEIYRGSQEPDAPTEQELSGMMETIEKWLPEELDNFVMAADAKNYDGCQSIFDRAVKAGESA